jgi:hypothetical protein
MRTKESFTMDEYGVKGTQGGSAGQRFAASPVASLDPQQHRRRPTFSLTGRLVDRRRTADVAGLLVRPV